MEGWYYGFTDEYMFFMGMLLARSSRKVGDLHTTRWCICAYIASFFFSCRYWLFNGYVAAVRVGLIRLRSGINSPASSGRG